MKVFADHCANLSMRGSVPSEMRSEAPAVVDDCAKWGGVLLRVLTSLHESSQQVSGAITGRKERQ